MAHSWLVQPDCWKACSSKMVLIWLRSTTVNRPVLRRPVRNWLQRAMACSRDAPVGSSSSTAMGGRTRSVWARDAGTSAKNRTTIAKTAQTRASIAPPSIEAHGVQCVQQSPVFQDHGFRILGKVTRTWATVSGRYAKSLGGGNSSRAEYSTSMASGVMASPKPTWTCSRSFAEAMRAYPRISHVSHWNKSICGGHRPSCHL